MGSKINSHIELFSGGKVSLGGKSRHRKTVFVDCEADSIKAFKALQASIQHIPDDRLAELQASIASEKNRRKRR